MSAQIVINGTTGSLEVALNALVTLSNFSNSGVLGWQWQLFDKPAGSVAALSAANATTCTFTADLAGEYAIALTTYRDALRTQAEGADFQIAGVRYTFGAPWRLPAAKETIQFDAVKGWKTEVNRILADLHDMAVLYPTALFTTSQTVGFGARAMVNLAGAAGNVTITPPSALGQRGRSIAVQVVGAASGRQAIFDPAGSETVNGAATNALTTDWAFAEYQSDNANWIRVR